jgi:hypothetical protein
MDDAHFFQEMTTCLMEEPRQAGYLVTLCDYAHSSPQPKGALWFYHPRTPIGSLSSGCLERILAGLFEQNIFQSFPFFIYISQNKTGQLNKTTLEKKSSGTFWYQSSLPFLSLTDFLPEDTQYSFLPCQGSLVLLIEKIYFDPKNAHDDYLFSFYQQMAHDLKTKKHRLKKISFLLPPKTGRTNKDIYIKESIDTIENTDSKKNTTTRESMYSGEIIYTSETFSPTTALKEKTIAIDQTEEGIYYTHRFGIRYPLVLIGWNTVAFYLAQSSI